MHDLDVPVETRFVRTGVDVVSIGRIERLLGEFGDSFRERAFTPAERGYCDGRPDPPQHYAARWAAKEAFLKALGGERTVPLRTIGIARHDDGPRLALGEPAREALDATAREAGVPPAGIETAVSMSHDRTADRAIGQVVIVA